MAFRQWSDKGYIHCRVTILIGTCNNCHAKYLEPGADKVLDEAQVHARRTDNRSLPVTDVEWCSREDSNSRRATHWNLKTSCGRARMFCRSLL
jgi:hypothetical protein